MPVNVCHLKLLIRLKKTTTLFGVTGPRILEWVGGYFFSFDITIFNGYMSCICMHVHCMLYLQ